LPDRLDQSFCAQGEMVQMMLAGSNDRWDGQRIGKRETTGTGGEEG
jgi:hypothetical protein